MVASVGGGRDRSSVSHGIDDCSAPPGPSGKIQGYEPRTRGRDPTKLRPPETYHPGHRHAHHSTPWLQRSLYPPNGRSIDPGPKASVTSSSIRSQGAPAVGGELTEIRRWFSYIVAARLAYLDAFSRMPPGSLTEDCGTSFPSILDIFPQAINAFQGRIVYDCVDKGGATRTSKRRDGPGRDEGVRSEGEPSHGGIPRLPSAR